MTTHRRSRVTRRTAIVAAAVAVAVLAGVVVYVWPSSAAPPDQLRSDEIAAADPTATASVAVSPAVAAATATPAPSAAPTKTAVAPPRGGKPGPGNTGVPAGTNLAVVNGDQTYSTAGQVVSGLDIRGFVKVTAKNVTIKNSIVRGRPNPKCNSAVVWVMNSGSLTMQDSEIAPSNPSPCVDGVWATNTTMLRLNIHHAVDGVKAYDNVTLQDSYIHDLSWFSSDPNQGGGSTHNDAVQSYEGDKHVLLRHNTMSPGPEGNAAYQVTQDGGKQATDLRIEGNWLDGGGCTLNFSHKGGPTPMTGIYVTNNRFGRGSSFNCPILVSTQTTLSQVTGNVWDDTGKPIPTPQRHD